MEESEKPRVEFETKTLTSRLSLTLSTKQNPTKTPIQSQFSSHPAVPMSKPRRSPLTNVSPETPTQSKNQIQVHFTEEDEVNLLNCYLQIARSANLTKNSQPTLDFPALERIETALGPKFTHSHSHIADKLHRLKLQYHKFARTKSFVKTPHHRRILEIGRSIWGKSSTPRTKPQVISRAISRRSKQRSVARKEGVDLKNFSALVGEFSRQFPGNGVWREGLRGMEEKSLRGMNEKWVLLHIEEAELKARRDALLQQQLRITGHSEHLKLHY